MKNSPGIVLIFLCIAIILAAGCTNPGTTSAAPVAASTPIPTAAGQQEPVHQEDIGTDSSAPEKTKSAGGTSEPLKISGANDENRAFSVIREEGYTITASYPGTGVFIVHITDSSGKIEEYVFNEMGSGSYTGRKIVRLSPGKHFLEVRADGPWTVDLTPS